MKVVFFCLLAAGENRMASSQLSPKQDISEESKSADRTSGILCGLILRGPEAGASCEEALEKLKFNPQMKKEPDWKVIS